MDASDSSLLTLQRVERILEFAEEVDNIDLLEFDPTPIGPQGVKQVVDQVPLTESYNLLRLSGEHSFDCLRPLLQHQKPASQETMNPPITVSNGKVFSKFSDLPRKNSNSREMDQVGFTNCHSEDEEVRFRSYQSQMWDERFEEICAYKKKFGNCLVPHNWSENIRLAKWVKRQRYQYKLKKEGKHSTLTDEREEALEQLGFTWESHREGWEEKFLELKAFKKTFGHCSVPSTFPDNPQLSVWIQCQRRQFKLHQRGERSYMTKERIQKLSSLGFVWTPRQGSASDDSSSTSVSLPTMR